jgi:hypothetical protein
MASTVTSTARDLEASNSEYFSLANHADWQQDGSRDFTFVFCVNPESLGTNRIVSRWGGTEATYDYSLYYNAGTFVFSVRRSGVSSNFKFSTFGAASTGVWVMVVVRYDATAQEFDLSVNNGTPDNYSHTTGITSGTQTTYIGTISSSQYWDGKIGPSGYWKSTRLSDALVTSIYNSASGKFYKDLTDDEKTGLTFWADAVETSGPLLDASGNGHDFTDNNTVTSAAGLITYTAEKSAQFTSANSEYLSIADASQSGLSPEDSIFYMAYWVRLDSVGVNRVIASKWGSDDSNKEYLLQYAHAVTKFRFIIREGDGTVTYQTLVDSNTFGTPVINTWYFVQCYFDSVNNVIGISINNGAFDTAATRTDGNAGINDGTEAFMLGREPAGSTIMNGKLSLGVIANTAIPSASERTSLFLRGFGTNNTAKPALSSASYISVWELNEESSTRFDSVGSNDLTDNNTVTQADGVVLYTAPAPAGGNTSGSMAMMGIGT